MTIKPVKIPTLLANLTLLGVLLPFVGCSMTTIDAKTPVPDAENKPFSLGGKQIIWARASQNYTDGKWSWEINDPASAPDARSAQNQEYLKQTFENAVSTLSIELTSLDLHLTSEEKADPALVCSKLSALGHRGLLIVTGTMTREMFTIGFCAGHLDVRIEAWDIEKKRLVLSQEESANRVTPIIWVMNYHNWSGTWNAAAQKDLKKLLNHLVHALSRVA